MSTFVTALVAATNIVLGVAYCGYGVMTAIEMKRDHSTHGFSHFGLAWICMAFTCGPHHLDHGLHAILGDVRGGPLDLFSVVVGLPVGVIWLALRIEAFIGGRGDRFVAGTPRWLRAMPRLAALYVLALVGAAFAVGSNLHFRAQFVPNVLLIGTYGAISWVLIRTQLQNRAAMGGWSVSGLSLSAVFPTCALMHAVFALNVARGVDLGDIHGLFVDWLSVPASLYFLWVVHGLYRESLQDWNSVEVEGAPAMRNAPPASAAPAA